MNIQRSVLERRVTPVFDPGRAGGRSWAELLTDAGLGRSAPGAGSSGPGRRTRVPDEDIVLVGRKRGGASLLDGDLSSSDTPVLRRPAFRIRTTLLLGMAAYYMAWGLYQGIATQKPHAIQVEPTLNSRIVIT